MDGSSKVVADKLDVGSLRSLAEMNRNGGVNSLDLVSPAGSDHRPIILSSTVAPRGRSDLVLRSYFHYKNAWVDEENYVDIIGKYWRIKDLDPICNVKLNLKEFEIVDANLDNVSCEELSKIEKELDVLQEKEEKDCASRAKNDWLQLGDKNIVYFHRCASGRQAKNKILKLQNSVRLEVMGQDKIGAIFEDYFSNYFTLDKPTDDAFDKVINSIPS
uniref:Uncharacterized protein n=1 Tax=Cannabis sativa TaxID=3483 RepID=A0A803PDX5_CANSA